MEQMKKFNLHSLLVLIILLTFISCYSYGQLNFTVNSLADDEHSYAYDNPDTPDIDESMDGTCKDELGRCTLNAALGEAANMNSTVNITFSVEGTINLRSGIYISPGSTIDGGHKITLHSDTECMSIDSNTTVKRLTFEAAYVGLTVDGRKNQVGGLGNGNIFINCYTGLVIGGDSNAVINNYFGIDSNKALHPNTIGLIISGSGNMIGTSTICGSSVAGIIISVGELNVIYGNLIGTTDDGTTGYGNQQGVVIEGSARNSINSNWISGNTLHGIFISGAPPESNSPSTFIESNTIGLDLSGQLAIPNGNGIVITNAAWLTDIQKNIIAGNNQNGILIFSSSDTSEIKYLLIRDNKIGVNSSLIKFPNSTGISIVGNVNGVTIGSDVDGSYTPNTIIGNSSAGIVVKSGYGFSPNSIEFRKNIIKQNGITNLVVDTLSNNRIKPPYGLSLNGNTLAGIHDLPNVLIDVYKANRSEGPPSAYEWLGSTTTAGNGVFSFDIIDPLVEAVSVTATTKDGFPTSKSSAFAFLDLLTGIGDEVALPTEFALKQNYPNPFNPTTSISFDLPKNAIVTLKVYDVLGQEVFKLLDHEFLQAGKQDIKFNASNLTSGIYFYRIVTQSGENNNGEKFDDVKKMVLLK